jgi:hypothetical protein
VNAPFLEGDESGEYLNALVINDYFNGTPPAPPVGEGRWSWADPNCTTYKLEGGIFVYFTPEEVENTQFYIEYETGNLSAIYKAGKRYTLHTYDLQYTNNERNEVRDYERNFTPSFINIDDNNLVYKTVRHVVNNTYHRVITSGYQEIRPILQDCSIGGSSFSYRTDDPIIPCKTKHCGIVVNLITSLNFSIDDVVSLVGDVNNLYQNNGHSGNLLSKIYVSDASDPEQREEVLAFLNQQNDDFITLWIEVDLDSDGNVLQFNDDGNSGFYKGSRKIEADNSNHHHSLLSLLNSVFESTSNGLGTVIRTFTDPVSWLLEGIVSILDKAKIPPRFYDCTMDDYNPIVYMIFNTAEGLMLPPTLRDWQDGIMSDYWNQTFSQNPPISPQDIGQMRFALFCGAVDELFNTIKGIPLFLNLLVRAADDVVTAPLDLSAFLTDPDTNISEAFSRASINDALNAGLRAGSEAVDGIIDELATMHDPEHHCRLAHSLGRDIVFGLSFFVGVGEIKALAQAVGGAGRLATNAAARMNSLKWVRNIPGLSKNLAFVMILNASSPAANILAKAPIVVENVIELSVKAGIPPGTYTDWASAFVRTNADEIITEGGRTLERVHQSAPMPVRLVDDVSGAILLPDAPINVSQRFRLSTYFQRSPDGSRIDDVPIFVLTRANESTLPGEGDDEEEEECLVCEGRSVEQQYRVICNAAGGTPVAQQALDNICAQSPASELAAIGNILEGWDASILNTFFGDITAVPNRTTYISANLSRLSSKIVAIWLKMHTAGYAPDYRRRILELLDNNDNPIIIFETGNPSQQTITLDFNWHGEQINEPLQVIEDPESNELRFRFRYFRKEGSSSGSHVIKHHVIPATPQAGLPTSLPVSSLLNMQNSITNAGKKDNLGLEYYYTLANAYQLYLGEGNIGVNGIVGMSMEDFFSFSSSPLTVWKSLDPEIPGTFTADHRRPMAVRLAGFNDQAMSVDWVAPNSITRSSSPTHWWKMTTEDKGKDIEITVHYINIGGQDKFCPPNTIDRFQEDWVAVWNGSSYQILNDDSNPVSWETIGAMIPGDCGVCLGRPVKLLYNEICSQAGSTEVARQGLEKICTLNNSPADDSRLNEIGEELLSWSNDDLNAFFTDITAASSSSDHLANHVGGLQVGIIRAWVALNGVVSPLKTDIPTLFRLYDDFTNAVDLEPFLSANPIKVNEWLDFDDFFIHLDDAYWGQFNNPPNVLIQTRTKALKALREYPNQYVEALESFGLSKSDLYTRHGVDYGDEFFQIIADFKASNNYGLTDAEIYAIFGYTTNFFYWNLNNWLRQGINVGQTQLISDLINSGLNKLPSWSGSVAYRGIKVKPPNVQDQINTILSRYIGRTSVLHGEFISVGSNHEASFLNNPNVKIRIEFDLKPNSDAKDISSLADGIMYRGNPISELLFPPNMTFQVDVITPPDTEGVVTIFLTEL